MNFEEKINEELRNATKSGEKLRMETLRSLRASIIEFNKSGIGRPMNDDDAMKILQNAAKRRRDAIEMYEKGNRFDLSDKEKAELLIIQEFLPAQISFEEVREIIKKIIVELGVTDVKEMGKVMGVAMSRLKGQTEGSVVQQIVRSLLT